MTRTEMAQSGPMSEEGARITARRERLKWDKTELAAAAGVHRDTVTDIEAGKGFQVKTLNKILAALDDAEAAAGTHVPPRDPEPGIVTLEVEGVFGVARVAVKGPVSDSAELRRLLSDVIADLRRDAPPGEATPSG